MLGNRQMTKSVCAASRMVMQQRRCLQLIALCWVPAAVVACGESTEIGQQQLAISGGTDHSGHLAIGQLKVNGSQLCAGTLVGKQTVLTSAHCVKEAAKIVFVLDDGKTFEVASTAIHPGHSSSSWPWSGSYYDIAVLRLKTAPQIKGIEVSPRFPNKGLPVTIIGYGHPNCVTTKDFGFTTKLGKDAISCTGTTVKRIAQNTIAEVFEHEISIEGKANACKGDSGGAVLAKINGKELLVGIPANGAMPCGVQSYSTRIDAFLPWIDKTAKKDLLVDRSLFGDGRGDGSLIHLDASATDTTIFRGNNGLNHLSGGCELKPVAAPGARMGPLSLIILIIVFLGRHLLKET
jgi:Trypsin